MLLRIEDTDRDRSRPELIQVIFDALDWLGLDWDGDVIHQSENAARHAEVIDALLTDGAAYRCMCTQDDVVARTKAAGAPQGYDGFCRDRDVASAESHVVRFRVPDDGATSWIDLVRGEISFDHANLEDFVLRRRDGNPMFIVANAVDDVDEAITHVVRGEDLINVTPKMLLVRAAMGVMDPVEFAHLPLIVNEQRKKLSKRLGDVAIENYQARGVLAEAMVNYLALLGWGPADGVEVRPVSEITALFELSDIGQSSAMFDIKKLEAVNGEWVRGLDVDEFVRRARPFVASIPGFDEARFVAIAPELQTRVKVLSELPGLCDFLFLDEPAIDDASWAKAIAGNVDAPVLLDAAIEAYSSSEWTTDALHSATLAFAERAGLKLGKAQAPIRVAVTGRTVGPPLFESLVVLGSDATLARLRAARERC